MRKQNRPRGFTLIELMMVVAIIAIGASMAVASYDNLVCRAQETEVKAGLEAIAVAQEAYRAEYGRYAAVQWTCGGGGACIEYRPKGSRVRYTYWGTGNATSYRVWGNGNFGTQVWGSQWILTQNGVSDLSQHCTNKGCDTTGMDDPSFGALLLVVLAVRSRRRRGRRMRA